MQIENIWLNILYIMNNLIILHGLFIIVREFIIRALEGGGGPIFGSEFQIQMD